MSTFQRIQQVMPKVSRAYPRAAPSCESRLVSRADQRDPLQSNRCRASTLRTSGQPVHRA
eukprot:CAMPEP_0183441498 /NCGR_PEP_ID=MMETSP0370-20130417/84936_1 /TAXON_ID=268820 /ORGANISM="Peridinium aciculiferum, Strain PAER-2" /LENGTH=59 /DNA_ID=CAMNT_0025630719 /DNA_START=45 /DNA_END=220 /DNA_ORIENTATION=-